MWKYETHQRLVLKSTQFKNTKHSCSCAYLSTTQWRYMGKWWQTLLILNLKPHPNSECNGRFTPMERFHGTHWLGGWLGPRRGWTLKRWDFLPHHGNQNNIPWSSSLYYYGHHCHTTERIKHYGNTNTCCYLWHIQFYNNTTSFRLRYNFSLALTILQHTCYALWHDNVVFRCVSEIINSVHSHCLWREVSLTDWLKTG